MTRLTTFADPESTAARAAVEIARALEQAREQRGVAHLALSGGSTPKRTYELLATVLEDWEGVEIWFADERCVGPEDEESNYRMAAETLLRPAGLDPARVHRMIGELGPDRGRTRLRRGAAGACLTRGWQIFTVSPLGAIHPASPRPGRAGHRSRRPRRLAVPGRTHARRRRAGDLPGCHQLPQAAARANHIEPRGAARRPALPAAGDRRGQGRCDRRGAGRADQACPREPARTRAVDGDRR